MHGGTCSPFPPPTSPTYPPQRPPSFHLSQQASRERRLLIGCGGSRRLCPAAVTRGFRCEARAGEAVGPSAVRCVPRRLEGRHDQTVCGPERFRPVRGIMPILREGSGRGAGLRPLRMRARRAAGGGARGVGGCARTRAGGPTWALGGGEAPGIERPATSVSRPEPIPRSACVGGRVVPGSGFRIKEASRSRSSAPKICLGAPGSHDRPETGGTVGSLRGRPASLF